MKKGSHHSDAAREQMTLAHARHPELGQMAGEDLGLFRSDPDRERSLGIEDYVVCRECGGRVAYLSTEHHLLLHGMTVRDYRDKWPRAPIYSPDVKAKRHENYVQHKSECVAAAAKWKADHPDKFNEAQVRYRAKPESKRKAKARQDKRIKLVNELLRLHRLLPFPEPAPNKMKAPKNPPHRPRKDEEATQVAKLKGDGLSWKQIAIKLNHGKKKVDQKKPDAFRSLWRSRHPHGEKVKAS